MTAGGRSAAAQAALHHTPLDWVTHRAHGHACCALCRIHRTPCALQKSCRLIHGCMSQHSRDRNLSRMCPLVPKRCPAGQQRKGKGVAVSANVGCAEQRMAVPPASSALLQQELHSCCAVATAGKLYRLEGLTLRKQPYELVPNNSMPARYCFCACRKMFVNNGSVLDRACHHMQATKFDTAKC